VKPIDGEEAFRTLRESSTSWLRSRNLTGARILLDFAVDLSPMYGLKHQHPSGAARLAGVRCGVGARSSRGDPAGHALLGKPVTEHRIGTAVLFPHARQCST
jgi:hypothetical protein